MICPSTIIGLMRTPQSSTATTFRGFHCQCRVNFDYDESSRNGTSVRGRLLYASSLPPSERISGVPRMRVLNRLRLIVRADVRRRVVIPTLGLPRSTSSRYAAISALLPQCRATVRRSASRRVLREACSEPYAVVRVASCRVVLGGDANSCALSARMSSRDPVPGGVQPASYCPTVDDAQLCGVEHLDAEDVVVPARPGAECLCHGRDADADQFAFRT